jgi:hypothetical protein
MRKYKVFNVGSRGDGAWIRNPEMVNDPLEADIITFPGGSDINPAIYGDVMGSHTWAYEHADDRDLSFLNNPALKNKFKIGLCRGAQLLTAISGGKLVQHFQHGHGGGHGMMIHNNPDQILIVNSLHHQMMFPFNLPEEDYVVIGRACNPQGGSLATSFLNGHDEEIGMPTDNFGFIEPETVYYPKTRSLCFQFHPEMMSWKHNPRTLTFCNNLLDDLYRRK